MWNYPRVARLFFLRRKFFRRGRGRFETEQKFHLFARKYLPATSTVKRKRWSKSRSDEIGAWSFSSIETTILSVKEKLFPIDLQDAASFHKFVANFFRQFGEMRFFEAQTTTNRARFLNRVVSELDIFNRDAMGFE